jgi:enoyl-CoA hydratase/carnithine racemase
MARTFAAKPPQALRLTKNLMKTAYDGPLDKFLDKCGYYQGLCHNTEDHIEAVTAFIEKRKPVFKGK